MTPITALTATEIAQQIKAGELSACAVLDAHIHRIEQVNPQLNAVVIPRFEQARQEAEAADAAQRRGDALGPLHGVPITIKEQLLVKDTATTFGVLNLKDHQASEDGPLVKRLRVAGAIILGKTNTAQLLMYIESDNPVYGRTHNPWNLERSPGGSSGGEAAIIAAGGSPLGLGSDFGGSIREPSHFCGIQGLKPTVWRLTNLDTRPGIFADGQTGMVPQPGPLARSVADLTLAMRILAAPGFGTHRSPCPARAVASLRPRIGAGPAHCAVHRRWLLYSLPGHPARGHRSGRCPPWGRRTSGTLDAPGCA